MPAAGAVNTLKPLIRLPFCFDAAQMAEEVGQLPDSAWMAHPSRLEGNSAVALISRGAGDNDEFDGAMAVTDHLRGCPYLMQVMASFGEVLGRSRLMRLAAGSEVAMHVDFNYHWVSRLRLHIPIVTDPAVIFYCADERAHMQAGECWTFNSWRRHRVENRSAVERIHLVIDTSGSSRLWRLVRAAQEAMVKEHDTVQAEMLAHDPDARPGIETERFNSAPVMTPGELDGLVASLVSEFTEFPGNDQQLVTRYRELLDAFCKDWRVSWHRYGYRPDGWPRYRALIEELRGQLHPDPRALITASNQIGVNPIIIQRILAPALNTARHEDLLDASPSAPGA